MKRLVPKAWMKLRHCCGSPPAVTYYADADITAILCESCGLYAANCSDHEVIEHWNGRIVSNVADDEEWDGGTNPPSLKTLICMGVDEPVP